MNSYILTKADPAELADLRRDYLQQLIFPRDGMWEAFVSYADHYSVMCEGEIVGYCAINAEQKLLQFTVTGGHDSGPIFSQIISELNVTGAFLHSFESQFLAPCMDHQKSVAVNALQYQAPEDAEIKDAVFPPDTEFRLIEAAELELAVDLANKAIGADPDWLRAYLSDLIAGEKLFGLWQGASLIATGEFRPSDTQRPYADVGMIVSEDHRRQGLATSILRQLIHHCRGRGLRAICSTERGNIAAQKAITKAGFVGLHRVLEISFEDSSPE